MWKDFFFFSKAHKSGIVVLLVLTILVMLFNFTLPLFFPKTDNTPDIAFVEEIEEFKRNLLSRDSLRRIEQERVQAERRAQFSFSNRRETQQQAYTLFTFDPNEADSATFVRLGIRPNTARSIIRYRERGGIFRTPDDFQKIYGISEEKFEELKPYIAIRKIQEEKEQRNIAVREEIPVEVFTVELNTADTTELMRIRGIGRFYAREIVRYRQELGGFASVEQLLEVRNMRAENYEQVAPFFTVDNTKINKIKVNTASVEFMRRHPYINFHQARAVFELRRAVGKLNNIRDLTRLSEFSDEDRKKLEPYFCFE
jgi:competence ComEA-like helix-hairpin-helix protein